MGAVKKLIIVKYDVNEGTVKLQEKDVVAHPLHVYNLLIRLKL